MHNNGLRNGLVRRVGALAGMAVTAIALGACGSDDASESASGGANIDRAEQLVAKYAKQPTFSPPGEAFDAAEGMKGKKIMGIGVTDQIPLVQEIYKEMGTQAKRVGFTFTHWQNQGKPDQWVQGINTAINQDYNAIDLLGIDPKLVRPQIEKAREAGIKVISSHLAGFGWEVPDYIDGAVRLPYKEVGSILAARSIVDNKGKVSALAIVANDLASSADVVAGLKAEYAADCPDCKLKVVNVPSTQWTTGVQNEVSSGIQRDPNLNYVIPIYDAMSQFAVAGIAVAGKAGKIPISTFNGTPFALDLVREGKVSMNIGENEAWIGRAMLDANMRAAMGQPVPETTYDKAPLVVFTKENVETAGVPAEQSKGYGEEWQAGFDKLWGIG
ncbi:MAG: sugar transporter substrate-binding protein [Solirubrobacterales bacterium]|jgi:ribose transport system substrate-binding protein|nr:sugar transporter substrate-binding protein [Solirubrobacterales bacterium]